MSALDGIMADRIAMLERQVQDLARRVDRPPEVPAITAHKRQVRIAKTGDDYAAGVAGRPITFVNAGGVDSGTIILADRSDETQALVGNINGEYIPYNTPLPVFRSNDQWWTWYQEDLLVGKSQNAIPARTDSTLSSGDAIIFHITESGGELVQASYDPSRTVYNWMLEDIPNNTHVLMARVSGKLLIVDREMAGSPTPLAQFVEGRVVSDFSRNTATAQMTVQLFSGGTNPVAGGGNLQVSNPVTILIGGNHVFEGVAGATIRAMRWDQAGLNNYRIVWVQCNPDIPSS